MIETQVGKVKTGHTTGGFTVIIPFYLFYPPIWLASWPGRSPSKWHFGLDLSPEFEKKKFKCYIEHIIIY